MVVDTSNVTIDLIARDKRFGVVMKRTLSLMKKVQGRMESLSRAAKRTLIVGGASLITFLKFAAVQESSEKALDAALKVTGNSLVLWSDNLKRASEEIQRLTVHGDEAVQVIMALLLNFGIAPEKIDEATRAAIGLSAALGQDLKSGMRQVALAMSGQFTLLGRYIPGIRTAKTETEKLAVATEFWERGFVQAQIQTKTLTGRFKQLIAVLGDMAEVIGEVLLPSMTLLLEKTKAAVKPVQKFAKVHREAIKNLFLFSIVATGVTFVMSKFATMVFTSSIAVISLFKALTLLTPILLSVSATFFAFAAANPFLLALIAIGVAITGISLFLKGLVSDSEDAIETFEKMNKESAAAEQAHFKAFREFRSAKGLEEQNVALEKMVITGKKVIEGLKSQRDFLEEDSEAAKQLQRQISHFQGTVNAATRQLKENTAELKDQAAAAADMKRWEEAWKKVKDASFKALDEMNRKTISVQKEGLDRIKELTRAIDEMQGVDPLNFEVEDLRALGVAENLINRIVKLTGTKRKQEKLGELKDEASALKESLKTNQQLLADEIKRIDILHQRGLITDKEAAKAKKAAQDRRAEDRNASLLSAKALFNRIAVGAASRRVAQPLNVKSVTILKPKIENAVERSAKNSELTVKSLESLTAFARAFVEKFPLIGGFGR